MSDEEDLNPYGYEAERWGEAVSDEVFRGRARREAKRILHEEENPPQTLPEVLDLKTRLARPRAPTTFRIEGWQPKDSRVVLAAQYKVGKTSLTGNLVRSLVDGDPWLGKWDVEPIVGTVGILDFEMSANQAEDWLATQDIQAADRVVLVSLRGHTATFNIMDPGVRRQWAELLAEHAVDYLILDCLRPLLDALGLDEHRDVGKILGPFDALLGEAQIREALVVHHMGHNGERSRGDSRIRDWPDVEWRYMRENESPSSPRYIAAFGRDVDVPDTKILYDTETRRVTAAKGTREDKAADAALAEVLHVLGEAEAPLSGRALETELATTSHTREAIRGALRIGLRRSLIVASPGPRRSTLYAVVRSWVSWKMGREED
jgi:hypothetical protein